MLRSHHPASITGRIFPPRFESALSVCYDRTTPVRLGPRLVLGLLGFFGFPTWNRPVEGVKILKELPVVRRAGGMGPVGVRAEGREQMTKRPSSRLRPGGKRYWWVLDKCRPLPFGRDGKRFGNWRRGYGQALEQ